MFRFIDSEVNMAQCIREIRLKMGLTQEQFALRKRAEINYTFRQRQSPGASRS